MATLISGLGGPAGFGEVTFSTTAKTAGDNDDGSIQVDITPAFGGGGINFFGTSYTSIFVNSNGLITFEGAETSYSPSGIAGLSDPAIAPFWTDIDITKGGEIYIDVDSTTGKVTVTWLDVEAFRNDLNPGQNSFQIVLTSLGSGDFDIEYIYEDIQWTDGGFGSAEAGITDGGIIDFELPGSGDDAELANYDTADFGGGDGAGTFSLNVTGGEPDIPIGRVDGTDGNDVLGLGFSDNESEAITSGDDIIRAGAGDDSIDAHEGSDIIYGEAGNDIIDSGAFNDAVTTTSVTNGANLTGTSGQDVFSWTAGTGHSATIRFNNSPGSSDGDGVADFVIVETTNNTGTLTIGDFDHGTDKIVLQENFTGINQNTSSGTTDVTITYANGNDQVFQLFHGGGSFDSAQVFTTTQPSGIGAADDDTLYGGDGADTFVMGDDFGADTIFGGTGNDDADTVDLSGLSVGATVTFTDSEDGTLTDGSDTATFDNVEAFTGTGQADTLNAASDAAGVTLSGGAGSDLIYGGTGADSLTTGTGEDTVYGGAGDDNLANSTGNDTLFGGTGNDTITASAGDDHLYGTAGNDLLYGGIDDDRLYGGTQNDTLYGGAQNDTLFGGDGDDRLIADFGADTFDGGSGTDTYDIASSAVSGFAFNIDLTTGNDQYGNQYVSIENVIGGTAADSINASNGSNLLYGGAGSDILDDRGGADTVYGGAGNDTLVSTNAASAGDDTFYGGGGDDRIDVSNGGDTAFGGDGSDTFVSLGSGFGKTVTGGEGGTDSDLLSWAGETDVGDAVDLTFAGNEAGTALIRGQTVTFSEIEAIEGTQAGDTIDASASSADQTLSGQSGNDTLTGGTGNDLVYGGDDRDVIVLTDGFGADTLYGGEGGTDSDTIDLSALGAGVTVTFTGDEQGTITDGTSTLTFFGFEGFVLTDQDDVFDAATATTAISVDARGGDDTVYGGDATDTISLGAGNDVLDHKFFGGGPDYGDDVVYGGAGNDVVDFDAMFGLTGTIDDDTGVFVHGNDTMTLHDFEDFKLTFGGDVVDASANTEGLTLFGRDGELGNPLNPDTLIGGSGNDRIMLSDGDHIVYAGEGDDSISKINGNDTIFFQDNFGDDLIDDGTGNDTADFRGLATQSVDIVIAASDTATATSGTDSAIFEPNWEAFTLSNQDDSFDGSLGTNARTVSGRAGNDSIAGGAGDDSFTGDAGNDTIAGGAGSDLIYGGSGADSLTTGVGEDTLYGGAGDDNLANSAGNDTLFGGAGNDTITASLGDDLLYGGAGNDLLYGGQDDDTLYGGAGLDTLYGGAGSDRLETGGGTDIVYGGDGADTVTNTGGGYDTVYGGAGNDSIAGSGSHKGGAGNDTIDFTGAPVADGFFNLGDGGTGDDSLTGSTGDEFFFLSAGDDTFDGGAELSGGDWISASRLGEAITVDLSSDTATFASGTADLTDIENVEGSDFADTISGDAGINFVEGEGGDDIVYGGGGADRLQGQAGRDTLYGGSGDDSVDGGTGNDTLIAGAGNDSLVGGTGNDRLESQAGADLLYAGAGDDILVNGEDNDTVYAGTGRDTLQADRGDDILYGGDDEDTFSVATTFGAFGADTIYGGEGGTDVDTLDLSALGAGVTVTYTGDEAGTFTDGTDTGTFFGIEKVVLTEQDDVLNASSDSVGVSVDGRGGDDTLSGGTGDDILIGGTGADDLSGGNGEDQINGDAGNDTIRAGDGNDSVYGGDGDDDIRSSRGNDTIFGGSGDDAIRTQASIGTGTGQTVFGGAGNDNVVTSGFNDTVYGGTGNDFFQGDSAAQETFYGGLGNDLIYSGGGGTGATDTVFGGDGDDILNDFGTGQNTLFAGNGSDTVNAGFGNDSVEGGAGADLIRGRSGNDTIDGETGDDLLYGGAGDDTLSGGSGNDQIFFGDGRNVVYGGAGNDLFDDAAGNPGFTDDNTIYGGDGRDTVFATDGIDTIFGGSDRDVLVGGGGADSIDAGSGNDSVDGGVGNDVIDGGTGNDRIGGNQGNDTLTGGTGDDTFVLSASGGDDTITDFFLGGFGSDQIDSSALSDVGNALTNQDGTVTADEVTVTGGGGADQVLTFPSGETVTVPDGTVDTSTQATQFASLVAMGVPPCFAPGTLIETPDGPRAVETLRVGDLVLTADRGPQPLRWIGRREVVFGPDNPRGDKDIPVEIKPGSLGNGLPRRRLIVSPQHRMVIAGPPDTDEIEKLIIAKKLTALPGIRRMKGKRRVSYIALLLDRHDVIYAEGAATESFRPGPVALAAFSPDHRAQIFHLYPGLADDATAALGPPARPIVNDREDVAALLAWHRSRPRHVTDTSSVQVPAAARPKQRSPQGRAHRLIENR